MFQIENQLSPWLTKDDGLSGKWLFRFQTQSTVVNHMKKRSECRNRNDTSFKRIILQEKNSVEKQKSEYTQSKSSMDMGGMGKDYKKKMENRKSEGGTHQPSQNLKEKKNIKKLHTQPHDPFTNKENKEVIVWKLKLESGRISGLNRKKEKVKKNFVLPKIQLCNHHR